MGEKEVIAATGSHPVTVGSLERDLTALGLRAGMTVLVHASLSRLGWVCGGPPAVILALENLLTPEGTLVMPAHSGDLSDPAMWAHPPVPESWWETIRREMPAYAPDLTPTRGMGVVAETFRGQDGTVRSAHPSLSFAAWGRHRYTITADHTLPLSLGEKSPLARIYELGGQVLLLGVGHDCNTSLHLAEYRGSYPGKTYMEFASPVMENGMRVWKTHRDLEFDSDDFAALGEDFERTGACRTGAVGAGTGRLMEQRALVDFAVRWIEERRGNRRSG